MRLGSLSTRGRCALSLPWVAFCVASSSGEFLGVEAGEGGALGQSDTDVWRLATG